MEGAQLEAPCTVSAESAPRRLKGPWHAFLWIYEGFFGLLLLQCTAGGRQAIGLGVCRVSAVGPQPRLSASTAAGLLGPLIPDAGALRPWNPHFLIML